MAATNATPEGKISGAQADDSASVPEVLDEAEIFSSMKATALVQPAQLSLDQIPDCSNVLQHRNFSDTADVSHMVSTTYEDLTPGGSKLNMFVWKPAQNAPRGAIVLCAGYLDSMTYVFSAWASEYTRLGLLVVGFNQPGMGSPGIPGLCEAWDNYIDNVLFATDTAVHLLGGTWTASGHPNVPLFIYGQSMGGALAIEASRRRPNAYRGVILSAPMCGIAPDSLPNGCSIAMLRCLEAIVPTAALVPQEDILTRCFKCAAQIKRVRARAAEMQFPDQPLLRTGVQLFDATLDIQAHVADFAPPSVLLIQGTLDKVTDGQLTRDFIQQCGAADKTYIAYKNAWHALEWEPVDTRMALIHDLTYWVAARVDAWEEGNPQLTEELQGREGVPVAAWGGGAAPAAPAAPSVAGGPSATSSAGHVAPSVSLGAVPAADSDMEWKREGGVLWGERPEGTGMIPDHDEISFFIVRKPHQASGGEAIAAGGATAVALDQTVNTRDTAALVGENGGASPA